MSGRPKKLHHFVPRFYLRAWARKELIFCLCDGEAITANLKNVGAENDFYRLQELSEEDTSFIRELAIKPSPEKLKPLHERLLYILSLPHTVKNSLENSGSATPEALSHLERMISEMSEDLHTTIENNFRPYLHRMLDGDLSFFRDQTDSLPFFSGLAAQYLRTNQIRRAPSIMEPAKLATFERTVNVLVHILAVNLGFNLYAEREDREIILLENHSEIPFITADQPIINIDANPTQTKPPDGFDLYYPISPSRAIMMLARSENVRPPIQEVSAFAVHNYNLRMAAHSYRQVFASSIQVLNQIKEDLPAFLNHLDPSD